MAARWVLHDIRSPAQSLTLLADLLGDPHTEFEKILRESVRITVADHGPGVAPHVADGLFESPVTTKAGPHPAGFGLLVAREVLRLSGGTLTRADGDGPGASFVIMLPHWRREAAPPRR